MPCTSCNGVRVEGAKTLEDVLRECIICVLLPLYCHSALRACVFMRPVPLLLDCRFAILNKYQQAV